MTVSSTVPIVVSWNASDATSGVNHYLLWESVDGAAYTQIGSPTGTKSTVALAPGHSYQFAVAAVDNANNASPYAFSQKLALKLIQETNANVVYSGGWKSQNLAGASGGSVKYATKAGKTATFSYTGPQVAWVSTEDTNRGSAAVSLDGNAGSTVDTQKGSLRTAVVVYTKSFAEGAHSLKITLLGAKRVDVDAFLYMSVDP